ncbi:rRNA maturation RNase YbeY [Cyanobacterium stanieri LEGE 03274]|uniref:Endoribonuclease YbeY n=1 Tax=Cyanobacterium stanieri LEGE 03274 TaxID=1828756 RepID=A0ABR9V597_9CHRO|nr:rRNA maturation RNase YbeY [Cyanobacterium stanieri]MBE9223052.1 rRNA maturation RNase YbeY [Cyanobacterium stanieri LEGE 03274]
MNKYNIDLYFEDNFFELNNQSCPIMEDKWRSWFATWLEITDHDFDENENYEISLIFTNDEEIKQLNSQFRQKNQATDVLSFASVDDEFAPLPMVDTISLGDIIISIETAQKQAQEQNHSLKNELAWLASHGFLHLLGWDHPNDDLLTEMLAEQQKLLDSVGIDKISLDFLKVF